MRFALTELVDRIDLAVYRIERLNMFSDLPPIDIDYEYAIPGQAHPQNVCQTYQPHLLQTPYEYELDPYFSRAIQRPHIDMPAVVPLESGGNSACESTRYSPVHNKSMWNLVSFALPGEGPSCSSWSATDTLPGRASSISSYAEESSLSEDGSYTPSGVWSPVFTKRDTHALLRPQSPLCYLEAWKGQEDMHTTYPCHSSPAPSAHVIHSSDCSGSGIALQDVQQYPDSYAEEPFDNTTEAEAKAPYVFPLDQIHARVRSGHFTEQHGERAVPFSCEKDGLKGDSSSEEDHESTSDYLPQPHVGQIKARPPKAITKHVEKPSAKVKRRSKVGRVSKRPAKVESSSETIVLSVTSKTTCPHCSQALHSKSALNKHITTAHTRPFTCTFRIYGCSSTFGSKNEWKRHVSSQHLRLGFWRCGLNRCLPQQKSDESDEEEEEELIFNDFNRKDLFTQHLRRMHSPPASSSASEKADFNMSLEDLTQRCFMSIRSPPPRSVCGFCTADGGNEVAFEGQGAWEARMEHVGRHLESGHGRERDWAEDQGLKNWLVSEGLVDGNDIDGWHLVGLQNEDRVRRR